MPRLHPDAAAGVSERVQDSATLKLRSRILRGEYPAGARLPAERRLAEELGISRLTLRSVLATLASEGLVRVRRGSGIEVLDFRRTGRLDLFSWLMAQKDAPPDKIIGLFAEIARLRRVVAIDTLMQAAGRALPEDIEELEAMAAAQARRLDDPIAYFAGDLEHQRAIIRIAGSTAIELLFNSLERLVWQRTDLVLVFMGPLDEHHASYRLVHQALRKRRSRLLRRAFEKALDGVDGAGLERVREYCHRLAGARPERGR